MYEENRAEINFGLKEREVRLISGVDCIFIYVLQTTGCGFVREKIRESRELQENR